MIYLLYLDIHTPLIYGFLSLSSEDSRKVSNNLSADFSTDSHTKVGRTLTYEPFHNSQLIKVLIIILETQPTAFKYSKTNAVIFLLPDLKMLFTIMYEIMRSFLELAIDRVS